jgi:tyrosine-protein kinase Etk/Wzc
MPEAQENIEEQEINLLELLQVLVKRKMLIIKMCSAAVVISVVISFLLPNIYSSTAKVLPPQKESTGGLSALLGQAGGLAGLAAASGLGGGSDLYLGILKSRSVADAVIQRLNLVTVYKKKTLEETRLALDKTVKVQAGKDGIISITAEDKDPKRTALLANAFVEELGRTTVRLNLSKAGTERLFLEKRLDLVKKDLKAAEDDLKTFAQQNKIVQVDSQAKASIEGIARMKADLASREVQLSILRATRTEQSEEVKALETGINRLRGELSKLSGNSSGGEGIPSVGNMPGVGLEYSRKLRELKTQEAIFEQLTKQYEMAKLSEAKDSSSFQVLDEAVVPIKKSKPARALIVIATTTMAFFISLFIIFTEEYLAKVSDEDKEIIQNIKKQVLAFK